MLLNFEGFIKDVQYKAFLTGGLTPCDITAFNINAVKTSGKIILPNGEYAYSKWVSPKRTRSYPFERMYNTFNSPTRLTVIPVLKDEGADGDLDRLQYSTISWMNLLNIYIVFAFYDDAVKNRRPSQAEKNKITRQKFNSASVNEQILRISQYKQSALHWNRSLLEDGFIKIFNAALESYARLSKQLGVEMHERKTQETYLTSLITDFENFKNISLNGSERASKREVQTTHAHEYLTDGVKATFQIKNYLGGLYYLTADEVIHNDEGFIIQESKNTKAGFLPGISDIKDGLFKLILFSNLDSLRLDKTPVEFATCLKLTGRKISGDIKFPCEQGDLTEFLGKNQAACSKREMETLHQLNKEASFNKKLLIHISSNHDD